MVPPPPSKLEEEEEEQQQQILSFPIIIYMPLCCHRQCLHCFKMLLCAMCIVHTTTYQSDTIEILLTSFINPIFPLLLICFVAVILQYNS